MLSKNPHFMTQEQEKVIWAEPDIDYADGDSPLDWIARAWPIKHDAETGEPFSDHPGPAPSKTPFGNQWYRNFAAYQCRACGEMGHLQDVCWYKKVSDAYSAAQRRWQDFQDRDAQDAAQLEAYAEQARERQEADARMADYNAEKDRERREADDRAAAYKVRYEQMTPEERKEEDQIAAYQKRENELRSDRWTPTNADLNVRDDSFALTAYDDQNRIWGREKPGRHQPWFPANKRGERLWPNYRTDVELEFESRTSCRSQGNDWWNAWGSDEEWDRGEPKRGSSQRQPSLPGLGRPGSNPAQKRRHSRDPPWREPEPEPKKKNIPPWREPEPKKDVLPKPKAVPCAVPPRPVNVAAPAAHRSRSPRASPRQTATPRRWAPEPVAPPVEASRNISAPVAAALRADDPAAFQMSERPTAEVRREPDPVRQDAEADWVVPDGWEDVAYDREAFAQERGVWNKTGDPEHDFSIEVLREAMRNYSEAQILDVAVQCRNYMKSFCTNLKARKKTTILCIAHALSVAAQVRWAIGHQLSVLYSSIAANTAVQGTGDEVVDSLAQDLLGMGREQTLHIQKRCVAVKDDFVALQACQALATGDDLVALEQQWRAGQTGQDDLPIIATLEAEHMVMGQSCTVFVVEVDCDLEEQFSKYVVINLVIAKQGLSHREAMLPTEELFGHQAFRADAAASMAIIGEFVPGGGQSGMYEYSEPTTGDVEQVWHRASRPLEVIGGPKFNYFKYISICAKELGSHRKAVKDVYNATSSGPKAGGGWHRNAFLFLRHTIPKGSALEFAGTVSAEKQNERYLDALASREQYAPWDKGVQARFEDERGMRARANYATPQAFLSSLEATVLGLVVNVRDHTARDYMLSVRSLRRQLSGGITARVKDVCTKGPWSLGSEEGALGIARMRDVMLDVSPVEDWAVYDRVSF